MIVSLSHYFWSLKKWEAHIETQIQAESLHIKHILFVSFQIHCGGVLCRCPNIYGPDCTLSEHFMRYLLGLFF